MVAQLGTEDQFRVRLPRESTERGWLLTIPIVQTRENVLVPCNRWQWRSLAQSLRRVVPAKKDDTTAIYGKIQIWHSEDVTVENNDVRF